MSLVCSKLHTLLCEGKRITFSMGYSSIPLNGIYIMYERGEFAHSGDRIVRIGTHTGDKQLKSRLFQHFENENKNRSIFRKNVGRCMLNREGSPYLKVWELDTTTKQKKEQYAHLIDKQLEQQIEIKISKYIQENMSFCLLEMSSKYERLYYETRLIGTVSQCSECGPSDTWLGYSSPKVKIRKSGLWQEMQLYTEPLSEEELANMSRKLVRK